MAHESTTAAPASPPHRTPDVEARAGLAATSSAFSVHRRAAGTLGTSCAARSPPSSAPWVHRVLLRRRFRPRSAVPVLEGQSRLAMRLVEDLFDLCPVPWGNSLDREVVELARSWTRRPDDSTTCSPRADTAHRFRCRATCVPVRDRSVWSSVDEPCGNAPSSPTRRARAARRRGPKPGGRAAGRRRTGRGIAPDLLPRLFEPSIRRGSGDAAGRAGHRPGPGEVPGRAARRRRRRDERRPRLRLGVRRAPARPCR